MNILAEEDLKSAFKMAKKLRAYAIHPDYKLLKKHHMWRARRRGFKVFPWTVNEEKEVTRLKSLDVDGVITDYPDRYAKV